MITILSRGHYELAETKNHIKILRLNTGAYAWIQPAARSELLVGSKRIHTDSRILSKGEYYMFDVDDEPELADTIHLELAVGDGVWQGYLLPTGLPGGRKPRAMIVPTQESIIMNLEYAARVGVVHPHKPAVGL